MSSERTK